jgi:hypothetical protein
MPEPDAQHTMFALKAALRKSMLKTLRQISQQELKAQCQSVLHPIHHPP